MATFNMTDMTTHGFWVDAFVSPRNQRQLQGHGTEIRFQFTGVSLTAEINMTTKVTVSIDGGAFVDIPTAGSGSWLTYTLASGLAEATHTCVIKQDNINTYINKDAFNVTGASPAVSVWAAYANQIVPIHTNLSFIDTGALTASTSEGYFGATRMYTGPQDSSIQFKGTLHTINAWMYWQGRKASLFVDNVYHSTITMTSLSNWAYITWAGLDDTAEHTYTIWADDGTISYFYGVMTLGGTGVNLTTPIVKRPVAAFYGDSITAGTNMGAGTTRNNFPQIIARNYGWAVLNLGIAGSTVSNVNGSSGVNRTIQVTGASPQPSFVISWYGTNDVQASLSQAGFQTAYQSMIQQIVTGLPANTPIYCFSIINSTSATNANRPAYDAKIPLAIAAVSPNSKVYYGDGSGFINATTQTGDGTHPTEAGAASMASQAITFINGWNGGGGGNDDVNVGPTLAVALNSSTYTKVASAGGVRIYIGANGPCRLIVKSTTPGANDASERVDEVTGFRWEGTATQAVYMKIEATNALPFSVAVSAENAA